MMQITFQGSPDEIRNEMAQFLNLDAHVQTHQLVIKSEPDTKTTKAEPKKAALKSETEPETPADTAALITKETVAGVIPKLMLKIGREKVVALLGEFGAKKGSEVKEKDFAEFLNKANALLA